MKLSSVRAATASLALVLAMALLVPAAAGRAPQSSSRQPGPDEARYVLQLADAPVASYLGGVPGLAPTNPKARGERRLDAQSQESRAYRGHLERRHGEVRQRMEQAVGRRVRVEFEYFYAFNGFTAELNEREAEMVARLPGVRRVQRDFERHIVTDAGPAWIGAPSIWDGSRSGGMATKGEGVVVGVIDTGVNHDHPSFADVGGDGFNHTNPEGEFLGLCGPPVGAPFCNDKLIGVYDFTGTSPLDDNGHGSHTASTAAGNFVNAIVDAPTIKIEREISGVAPHANLITYKACIAIGSCLLASLVAAIDQATTDGVDVINYSIGGGSTDPWDDGDALAFLGARDAGVFASVSAGNSGPRPETVGSPADAPWVMAVGASTHDRRFVNKLVNMSGGNNPPADMTGKSLTAGYGPEAIVYARDFGDAMCLRPFVPGTFGGQIVVCDRGVNSRVEKGRNVEMGGAGGLVLANTAAEGESTVADAHELPAVHVGFSDGEKLKMWLASGSGHTATISGTTAHEAAANGDVMAGFSSRGPNPSVPGVIKPDVTAPGVDVLAAVHTTNPTAPPEFSPLSGTSMSSPHAAGAAALVRAVQPGWTPAEVQSALTSTGLTGGVRKEDGLKPADAFDLGGGRIDLTGAARAGLVLDEQASAFQAADPDPASGEVGDPATLNLATLANQDCGGSCSWTRTVKNALGTTARWTASVVAPDGLSLSVQPKNFTLAPLTPGADGPSQTLTVTADASKLPLGNWVFAKVRLKAEGGVAPEQHLPVAVLVQTPTPVNITTETETGAHSVSVRAEANASKLTTTVSGLQEGEAQRETVEQDPTPLDPYDTALGTRSFVVEVPAGARLLTANTKGMGIIGRDVDLFVGRDDDDDDTPDAAEQVCAGTSPTANESCTLRAPAAGLYWVMVQTFLSGVASPEIEWVAGIIPGTDNGNLSVTTPRRVTAGQDFKAELTWAFTSEEPLKVGDAWFALVELGSDRRRPADVGALLVDLRRP